ncbi:MAG TPA: DNA translocase FtsK 4TM domain-containing protein [Gemmatimonadaceae bacterium]|nr:DNA translocase FtsK 4TM domain-containing protein [Gemmatimonadaceae bacterium]
MGPQTRREISGIALLLFGIFLAGALTVLGIAQLRAGFGDIRAHVGPVGYYLAYPLVSLFGWPAALMAPFAPAVHALRVFGRLGSETDRRWMMFFAGIVALLPIAVGLAMNVPAGEPNTIAGLWGTFVAYYLRMWLGGIGAWLAWIAAASTLTVVTLGWSPIRALVGRAAPVAVAVPAASEPPKKKRNRGVAVPDAAANALALEPPPEEMPAIQPLAAEEVPVDVAKKSRKLRKSKADADSDGDQAVALVAPATSTDGVGDELPPTDLLTEVPERYGDTGKQALDAMGVKLLDALRTFRIEGQMVGRTTGPAVTQFEIEPAPGVKVRQIANLSNDLALAMRAPSIRIVAPIPGRGAVGVEVPNPNPEIVGFRELVEHRDFQSARAALPIAIGKDLEGKPVISDLAKMPHLLIAGATGSGKSVCVNTIVTSLVYRHTPKTLRLLMVDPKMVELSVYNTLPHLRHKVVTDNRDAAAVLKWAVLEMQDRYELLAANGCRNIQDFNRRVQEGTPLKMPKKADIAFEDLNYRGGILPYIVVVIDEMADLMMTVQAEVETPIAMLAQKARAIGIHLILATQRPSVNVITGLIKANFPSRIAFRVASQVDSRTIIDGAGAEMLLGNGDMLFIPPSKSEPSRMQGAYISSEDTERLMKWYDDRRAARRAALAAQGMVIEDKPDAEDDIIARVREREALEANAGEAGDVDAGDRDKLFREAAEVVIQNQQGSTSLLQRRLKVGYGRAARIIDQLHTAGVLGPPDGSKPRDVLVGLDDLDRICGPRS